MVSTGSAAPGGLIPARSFPFSPCWHHHDALMSGGHVGMVVRWRGGVD